MFAYPIYFIIGLIPSFWHVRDFFAKLAIVLFGLCVGASGISLGLLFLDYPFVATALAGFAVGPFLGFLILVLHRGKAFIEQLCVKRLNALFYRTTQVFGDVPNAVHKQIFTLHFDEDFKLSVQLGYDNWQGNAPFGTIHSGPAPEWLVQAAQNAMNVYGLFVKPSSLVYTTIPDRSESGHERLIRRNRLLEVMPKGVSPVW